MSVTWNQWMNPPTVWPYSWGILLFFYSGKAPARLFIVLMLTVKPFDDVVAGYTARNSNQKRYEYWHRTTSSRCRVSVGQRNNYIIYAPGRQALSSSSSIPSMTVRASCIFYVLETHNIYAVQGKEPTESSHYTFGCSFSFPNFKTASLQSRWLAPSLYW